MCSECVQSVFRVCLECAQGAFRVCSECVQSAFSVCSECVQSVFNIDVISSPSASSVSIFGIFYIPEMKLKNTANFSEAEYCTALCPSVTDVTSQLFSMI